MIRPALLSFLLISLGAPGIAAAQSGDFEEPCAFDQGGVFLGIGWKTRGGHRILLDDGKTSGFTRFSFTLSLFGNDPMYELLRNKGSKPSFGGSMIRTSKGGGILIPQVDTTSSGSNFQEFSTGRVVYPGGNVESKEPRGVRFEGEITGRELDFPRRITSEMVQQARRQKLWTCSAFRVSVGTLPTESVIGFEPIEVTRTLNGDLDGDGTADYVDVPGPFAFDIPKEAAGPYMELLQATLDGRPIELPARVQYLDEDGLAILTLHMVIEIRGVEPTNVCLGTDDPSNNVRVFAKIKRELVIERERKG